MRKFETPYVADWFAASLRWIVLVSLVIALALRGELNKIPFWPLTSIFVWNQYFPPADCPDRRCSPCRRIFLAAKSPG